MEWNYITFRSVTYAQRGKKVLEDAEIPCTMIRSPGWMARKGCGYALKLRPELGERAAALLTEQQAEWLKRYRWDGTGRPEVL